MRLAERHGMRIIAAFFAVAAAAAIVGWLLLPQTAPPAPKTAARAQAPKYSARPDGMSAASLKPPAPPSPTKAPPRGPKIGEIVAPARRDVTPSTLTQMAHSSGPLVRVEGVAPRPRKTRPRKREETLHRVVVVDGGNLRAGKEVFRLARITALALDDTCASPEGGDWPCGMAARTALRRLIRGRAVTCRRAGAPSGAEQQGAEPGPQESGSKPSYLCEVGKQDLGEWMLQQGWAAPAQDDDAKGRALTAAAKKAGRGQWRQAGLRPITGDGSATDPSADDTFDDLVERLELSPEALQPALGDPDATGDAPADDFFANADPTPQGGDSPLQPALR